MYHLIACRHLPQAMVAAFAKRLARLSLMAPPQDILIMIPFIGNLLLRHKGLQKLINNPDITEGTYKLFQLRNRN